MKKIIKHLTTLFLCAMAAGFIYLCLDLANTSLNMKEWVRGAPTLYAFGVFVITLVIIAYSLWFNSNTDEKD